MTSAQATLSILDVGHGNASILREDDVVLLVDAGFGSHVLEYLQENGIGTIDLVLISHSDADHIGGVVGLLATGIRIKKVRLNSDPDKSSETWRDLVFALEDARRNGDLLFEIGLSVGDLEVEGLNKCRVEIVAPTPGLVALGAGAKDRYERRITSNSISACIRIHYEGVPIALLAGDMDDISLTDSVEAKTDLLAPIVVFPHHGGLPGNDNAAAFAKTLMEQTKASRVFFSIGRLKHENPRPDVINAVKQSGAYIACTQLSKHCADDLTGLVSNVSASYSAGGKKGFCCAGTVDIDLPLPTPHLRTQKAHAAFVSIVKAPLCR